MGSVHHSNTSKSVLLWKVEKTWSDVAPETERTICSTTYDIQFYDHVRLGTRCKIPVLVRNSTTLSRYELRSLSTLLLSKVQNCGIRSLKTLKLLLPLRRLSPNWRITSWATFLISLQFIPVYTTPNSNSILDWNKGGLQGVVYNGNSIRSWREIQEEVG